MARPLSLLIVLLLVFNSSWGRITSAQEMVAGITAPQPAVTASDAQLQRLATEQAGQGDWIGSMRTLSQVADGRVLAQALHQVQSALRDASGGSSASSAATSSAAAGQPRGGQGGANFADFAPLVELIQASIAPDSWEPAGGSGSDGRIVGRGSGRERPDSPR